MTEQNHDDTRAVAILRPGTAVGHFKIIEKVGAGGMGEVYSAEDTRLDRKIALKFLPAQMSSDTDLKTRFIREAKAAAKLNHPSIVTIHEVSEFNDRPYFAMEYVDGSPLKAAAKATDDLFTRVAELAIQICEGLNIAHSAGITHRDIKPANIMLDKNGHPKILDFGLATFTGNEQLTRTGSTLGTVGYMSPEQVKGAQVDNRTDLFSLGIVLYELIAGRRPFDRDSEAAVLNAILNDSPEPLSRYKSGVPEELERVISKLLEKTPNHRYQSATGVISDLRRLESTGGLMPSSGLRSKGNRLKLVVLPFENMGPADDEYFADGITEEITSRLAAVNQLGVISRTSALHYKGTKKTITEIGNDLAVDFVLEGTVRWSKSSSGSRVRITPQLIHVADDTHVWSDRYDRTLEDIFEVQSDIAERVIAQLNITLLEPEKAVIEAKPTNNMNAYHAYLRGREYLNRSDYAHSDFKAAVKMFESAIKLDPGFGLAYALLSFSYTSIYFHGHDRSDTVLKNAKTTMEKAFDISPELPGAYLAKAYWHYHIERDYESVSAILKKTAQAFPAETDEISFAIARRQGDLDKALKIITRIAELNPQDARLWLEFGITLSYHKNFAKADELLRKAEAMAPDQGNIYYHQFLNHIRWNGDLKKAKAALERTIATDNQRDPGTWFYYYSLAREFDNILKLLDSQSETVIRDQIFYLPVSYMKGLAFHLKGNSEAAIPLLRQASSELKDYLIDFDSDSRVLSTLGLTHAFLGEKEAALKFGRRATTIMPVKKDLFHGTIREKDLAIIEANVGEIESSLSHIENLLSIYSAVTPALLRLNPLFDVIRDDQRFIDLLKKYDTVNND